MSAQELITEHLDLWTEAVTKKSTSGRGSNSKIELTGIKKLRELILELAVRGKLVEPSPSEESASQLLSRIEAEKSRLVAQGLIKKPKKLDEDGDSQLYSLPPHWCWVRLGNVTNYGTTDKAEPNQVNENTWVLELEDIEKESSKLLSKVHYVERQFKSSKNRFERGDVLYGKLRPYLDKVLVADDPGVCTTEIIPIRAYLGIVPKFLRLALKSPRFKSYANDSTHGMNLPRLGTDKARLAMIPLAPEQEQHRIVQKVDELMALCDQLEQQTSDQLAAHETLVDTLLGTLTQSENATELADNWARLATHFDTLFTTEQSIEKLKQTILQLAVMGRLVEQDAGDEPADMLVSEILHSRDRLARTERMKTKADDSVSPNDQYIDTPSSWAWIRLGNMAKFIDYRGKTPTKISRGKRLITAKNIRRGFIDLEPEEFISEADYASWMTRGFPRRGDLLFTPEAPLGNAAIVDLNEEFALAQRAICFQWHTPEVSKFMLLQVLAHAFQKQLVENATGMTATGIKAAKLKEIPVAIPPRQEQHRIVQKVDELMSLCDQLKERLNQASETRCQLANAIVEQGLSA